MTKAQPKLIATEDAPTIGIFTVTPAYAAMLLERNEGNRKVSDAHVSELAHAMSVGDFRLNGESIKMAQDGRVLDGQHRLEACVRSGKDFVSVIVSNLPNDAFDTIDVGRKRSVGDILGKAGYSHTASLGATIRWAEAIRLDKLSLSRGGWPMSAHEVTQFARQNPDIVAINADVGNRKATRSLVSVTHLAPVMYHAMRSDKPKADLFLENLLSGESLTKGHPILTLRNHLIDVRGPTIRPRSEEQIATIINGWNAYKNDVELVSIGGSKRQRNGTRIFPQVA